MTTKELNWSFWLKISLAGIGSILLLSFLLGTRWRFSKVYSLQQDLKQKETKVDPKATNPQQPLRVQIMTINTITLFFLLMTIQEYRMNEFISPFGVDPEKIPEKCQIQQLVYYWVILILSLFMIGYNYLILSNVLEKANSENIIGRLKEKKSTERYGYVTSSNTGAIIEKINSYLASLKLRNGMFMVEKYPSILEFVFFYMVALFSIGMYIILVLNNYNVIETNIFKSCVHPLNNDRFYDPFDTRN